MRFLMKVSLIKKLGKEKKEEQSEVESDSEPSCDNMDKKEL